LTGSRWWSPISLCAPWHTVSIPLNNRARSRKSLTFAISCAGLLQAIAQTPLTLTALKSEDIEGTGRMKVLAQIRGLGRQDQALEQMVVRLSLEGGVTSVSWSVTAQVLE